MPHTFVVGTITDAARAAIEQAGGTIGPARIYPNVHTEAYLVTIPDEATIQSITINVGVVTLHLFGGLRNGTGVLDITKEQTA